MTTLNPAMKQAVPSASSPSLSRLPPGVAESGPRPLSDAARADPQPQDAMRADPALPVDKDVVEWLAQDQARWTRRYLLPWVRMFSCTVVAGMTLVKRMVPIDFRWHGAIDVLCIWFVRRFCSPTVAYFLMRHFVLETNLMNFVTRNSGADDVEVFALRPTVIPELGDHAVIRHDMNIYKFLIDLGRSTSAVLPEPLTEPMPLTAIDFSDVHCPPVDAEVGRFRWLKLDIETSLYLMNIPFCLFTTYPEYERAVNSFQLDESLFALIADITGDGRFRTWTPLKFTPFLAFPWDVPRALFWHACIHEYAHGRLAQLATAQTIAGDDEKTGAP